MYYNYSMGYNFKEATDAGEFVEFVRKSIGFDLNFKINKSKNPNNGGYVTVFRSNNYNPEYFNCLYDLFRNKREEICTQ